MTEIEDLPTTPWWRRKRVVVAAAVLVVLGSLAAVLVLVLSDDDAAKPTFEPAMLVVAREEATSFFALDYRDAEGSVGRVLELATGSFKDEYDSRKAEVIAQLKAKKLTCTASIPDGGAAIEFLNGDQAQVLVVVDVPETATCHPDATRDRTRILLSRVDGHWLVSGVNRVG